MPGPTDTALADTVTSQPGVDGPRDELPAVDERYTLRRRLARGGQAEVYVAFDRVLGREVAFKTPRADADGRVSSSTERRFLREAQITARLDHPNVITVHEIGRLPDGRPFCTMRLVLGEGDGAPRTLGEALRDAKGLRERLALLPRFLDVCNGVAHAHARGVVHRDLKPDNVVLSGPGETVVLDWGLARDRGHTDEAGAATPEADGLRTVEGHVFGTPLYMSPEQARGARDEVDERSDVWSLGVVLYELLTGTTPFRGDSLAAVLDAVRSAPVAPARALEPAAPPALTAVVQRALSRARGERYASAAELADDVRAFLEGRQVGVYDYSLLELARLFVSRYRTTAAVGGVGLALLLVALVAVGLSNRRAAVNLAEALVEKGRLAEAGLKWNEAAAFYAAALAQAPRRDASFGLRLAWARARASPVTHLRGDGREVRALAASPDGRRLAAGGTGDVIRVWEVASGRLERELRGHENALTGLAFLEGGAALLSTSEDGTVRRWRLDGAAPETLLSRAEVRDSANTLAVTADGRLAALAFERGDVVLVDLSTGAHRVLGRHEAPVYAVSFRPDGRVLASGSWLGDVRAWDVATGAVLALAYSPDGTRLASAGRDTTVRVVALDHDGPDRVRVLSGHQQKVYGLTWSSDAKLLVSVSSDGTTRVWHGLTGAAARGASLGDAEDLAAAVFLPGTSTLAWAGASGDVSLRTVPPQSTPTTVSTWEVQTLERAPDGELLLPLGLGFARVEPRSLAERTFLGVPDERGRIDRPSGRLAMSPDMALVVGTCGEGCLAWWDARQERPLGRFVVEGLGVERVAFSPDGRTLATVERSGALRVWDVATRAPRLTTPAHAGGAFGVAFSPDGRLLATAGYDKHIALWETAGFTEVARLKGHDHGVRAVAFSPDGRLLASASWDRTARLWDVATRAEVARLRHQDFAFGLDFSADGAVLATASHDGTVRLWDVTTHREELRLPSDEARVTAVRFSKDGRALFYAGRGLHRLELESDTPLPTLGEVLAATGLRLEGVTLTRAPR